MRSLKDYVNTFRDIATNLNLQGDSVELLVQLLANATYISEVENIYYVREASLEASSMLNSKIQHSMDLMYSVYRGQCPRVILNFKSNKYTVFNLYDVVATSNNFKLYYIGYYNEDSGEFIEKSCTVLPNGSYQIKCLIAKNSVDKTWTLNSENIYYVDCTENNLSNDIYVKIKKGSSSDGEFEEMPVTDIFSDHILNGEIFDLTLPGFGSRLFIPEEYRMANTELKVMYFPHSSLSNYNESELKRISVNGFELQKFDTTFINNNNFDSDREFKEGLLFLDCIKSSTLDTIHYKANHDRYVNSVIRSNSDIGTLLERLYPEKIKANGTSYEFSGNSVKIFYVPYDEINPIYLTESEIQEYVSSDSPRRAYYITDNLVIKPGVRYEARFQLDLSLYETESVSDEVNEILATYSGKFNMDLNSKISEISTVISKISNIKTVNNISITYISDDDVVLENYDNLDLNHTYFFINPNSTIITTT